MGGEHVNDCFECEWDNFLDVVPLFATLGGS